MSCPLRYVLFLFLFSYRGKDGKDARGRAKSHFFSIIKRLPRSTYVRLYPIFDKKRRKKRVFCEVWKRECHYSFNLCAHSTPPAAVLTNPFSIILLLPCHSCFYIFLILHPSLQLSKLGPLSIFANWNMNVSTGWEVKSGLDVHEFSENGKHLGQDG
jgi:hypothetical protein